MSFTINGKKNSPADAAPRGIILGEARKKITEMMGGFAEAGITGSNGGENHRLNPETRHPGRLLVLSGWRSYTKARGRASSLVQAAGPFYRGPGTWGRGLVSCA